MRPRRSEKDDAPPPAGMQASDTAGKTAAPNAPSAKPRKTSVPGGAIAAARSPHPHVAVRLGVDRTHALVGDGCNRHTSHVALRLG
mmetsp:Transcript_38855/g.112344  ORF Transcript_38855/g.112344 Transcript_38855/m.112344 type:complete len:86 (-) Transcript_38855:30-287(-)